MRAGKGRTNLGHQPVFMTPRFTGASARRWASWKRSRPEADGAAVAVGEAFLELTSGGTALGVAGATGVDPDLGATDHHASGRSRASNPSAGPLETPAVPRKPVILSQPARQNSGSLNHRLPSIRHGVIAPRPVLGEQTSGHSLGVFRRARSVNHVCHAIRVTQTCQYY